MCGLFVWLIALYPSAHAQTPDTPTNLQAIAVSPAQINLSWSDTSTNEDGLKIEQSLDGTNFTQIAQVLPNTTTYRHTGLFPGTSHTYRVRTYNGGDVSDYSNVAVANTPSPPCPLTLIGWGDNTYSQVTPPAGITGIIALAGGYDQTLALRSDGTVVGWGDNTVGQAVPPVGLTGVVAITAGYWHSLALKGDGTVVGWGYNGYNQTTPPAGLTGVVSIATGYGHSLALKSDGSVVGWGNAGQFDFGQSIPPVGLAGVVAISAGVQHSLALKSDGTVVGWGENFYGQTTPPAGLTGVVAIAAIGQSSLALKGDGTVVGWGYDDYGQATPPAGLSGVVAISGGLYHSLAMLSDGTVIVWGNNANGQSVAPAGLMGVTAIAAGYYNSLVLTTTTRAPSGLMVVAASTTEADLSWIDNSTDETGFEIERAPDASGSPGEWTQIGAVSTNVTVFSDTNVMTNTVFWYRARSRNTCGESPYSNLALVNIVPPSTPTNLVAVAVATNQVNLSWSDNSAGEVGFYIERAPDAGGGPGSWAQIGDVSAGLTTYTDSTVTTNTAYWYRVRAYNGLGDSAYSNQAFVNVVPPVAPSGLTGVAVSASQVNLSWVDNSSTESGFKVERAPNVGGAPGTWIQIATVTGSVMNYSSTGLTANTTYWYRVRAYNGVGNSTYTTAVSVTTPFIPFAPSNLAATVVSSNQVNLSWTDNSGNEDGFKIERSRSLSFFDLNITLNATVGSNVTTYSDTAVTTNQTHWYRVRSYNSSGNSAYTAIVGASIPSLPAAPSGLTATGVSSNQINLSWKDNSNNEGVFKIERAPDNGFGTPGTWSQVATVSSNIISYSDTGLATATRYWYRVRASNVSGDSPYSNTANASTATGQNVWINPASDKWELAPNWSQGVPSSAQAALLITNANSKTITIDATTAASNSANGCLAIGGLTILSPNGSTNTLNMVNAGFASPLHVLNSLTITNGSAMSITNSALQVDGDMRVDGRFTMQPDTQVVMSNTSMYVGSVATGQVTMSGGAMNVRTLVVASNLFSVGTFTMTGGSLLYSNMFLGMASNTSASAWLTGGDFVTTSKTFSITIGRFGNAQMTVSNGATVRSWITRLGAGNSAVGTLTVAGGNADLGGLFIGDSSNATAAAWISSGQLAATNQGITIASSYSVAQMTISNATVLAGNQFGGTTFDVGAGSYCTGVLTMCAGTLSSLSLTDYWYVGFSSGSKGSVWIGGGTVTATNGNGYLFLGLSGAGEWVLTNGSVAVANLYEGLLGGTGTLTIAGGSFTVMSNAIIGGASSTVWVTGGQLLTPNGTFVLGNYGPSSMTVSGGVAVAREMIISSNNTAAGVLSISGGQVTVFDSLVVGDCASNAIGQITVNGGTLYVTNATHTGYLDLRGGTLTVSSGALVADKLVMTNSCGRFVKNGGSVTIASLQLDPALDADADGIPNGYEQSHGLDPLDSINGVIDSDGDGLTDLQEYLTGTEPTNSASAFRITSIAQVGTNVLVTWTMGTGKTNALQRTAGASGSYATNGFSDIFTVTNTVGGITNYLDLGGATNFPSRFYRVRLVP